MHSVGFDKFIMCVFGFSREMENFGYSVEEISCGIMEAELCHCMPSASWRTRKASGRIQVKSEGLRSRGAEGVTLRLDLDGGGRCSEHLFYCQYLEE